MSLLLTCPHCGKRPIEEFMHREIPQVPNSITDPYQRDIDRAFMITNREGKTKKAWFHTYECRR